MCRFVGPCLYNSVKEPDAIYATSAIASSHAEETHPFPANFALGDAMTGLGKKKKRGQKSGSSETNAPALQSPEKFVFVSPSR